MEKCDCKSRCKHYVENPGEFVVYCYQMNAAELKKDTVKWNKLKNNNQPTYDGQKIFYVGGTSHTIEARIKQHIDLKCKKNTPKQWGEYLVPRSDQLLQQYPGTLDELSRKFKEEEWARKYRAAGHWVYQK